MSRQPADPFGFLGAINWDAVDEHADEIAAIFEDDEPEDEVQYEDCQGYEGGCGSPSCLTCNPDDPCCYNSTRNFGTGDHEVDCPNYRA